MTMASDFTLIDDQLARQHAAWPAFVAAMKDRAYGHGPLNSAWMFFKQGWAEADREAAAALEPAPVTLNGGLFAVCGTCGNGTVPAAGTRYVDGAKPGPRVAWSTFCVLTVASELALHATGTAFENMSAWAQERYRDDARRLLDGEGAAPPASVGVPQQAREEVPAENAPRVAPGAAVASRPADALSDVPEAGSTAGPLAPPTEVEPSGTGKGQAAHCEWCDQPVKWLFIPVDLKHFSTYGTRASCDEDRARTKRLTAIDGVECREVPAEPATPPAPGSRPTPRERVEAILDGFHMNQNANPPPVTTGELRDRLTRNEEAWDARVGELERALETSVEQTHKARMGNSQLYATVKRLAVELDAVTAALRVARNDARLVASQLSEVRERLGRAVELLRRAHGLMPPGSEIKELFGAFLAEVSRTEGGG